MWTALIPIKPAPGRKTRLGRDLDVAERGALTDFMLGRVLSALDGSVSVGDVVVLAAEPPRGWNGSSLVDLGRGLNAELQAAARGVVGPLIVIHADLPALSCDDIDALVAAAATGVAIAPDRWLQGTNALAAHASADLAFAFGPGSFRRHRQGMAGAAVVRRRGLAFDVDLPDDLAEAVESGSLPSCWAPRIAAGDLG